LHYAQGEIHEQEGGAKDHDDQEGVDRLKIRGRQEERTVNSHSFASDPPTASTDAEHKLSVAPRPIKSLKLPRIRKYGWGEGEDREDSINWQHRSQ